MCVSAGDVGFMYIRVWLNSQVAGLFLKCEFVCNVLCSDWNFAESVPGWTGGRLRALSV